MVDCKCDKVMCAVYLSITLYNPSTHKHNTDQSLIYLCPPLIYQLYLLKGSSPIFSLAYLIPLSIILFGLKTVM